MMRKLLLLLLVLCGLVQRFECSRMKFEPAYHDPVYRHDPHMHGDPVYKREHFYPRESLASPEQILPQQSIIRNEPIYANEALMGHPLPQQALIQNEEFIPNQQMMPSESFIRKDAFIRREPVLRREGFLRSSRIYPTGGVYRNEPNSYSFMVSQCPCQEPQNVGQTGAQETFFQIQQPIQPMQQQPMLAHRLILSKSVLKPQGFQPIVTFPRIQRYVRKNFKPISENIQFSAPAVQNTPVQEFNSFNNDPVTFPGNFQNQGQQQESTSESVQNNPVTVRNVPQMPNPLTLAQMSSIC